MITLEQFTKMIPTNKESSLWYNEISELFKKYNINTKNRIAGVIAQTAHESNEYKTLTENLNYSAAGLLKTFPNYFTKETAAQYAKKPELIANHVYNDANRKNKLGNTKPGDGWKFRGRGIIQLTGRWNYDKFGKTINMTAEQAADYLETKKGALESALWFWTINNINRFADSDDIIGMSKAVNGGETGLQDRKDRYAKNKSILGSSVAINKPVAPKEIEISLSRGSRGELVSNIQKALKLSVDGIFGVTTEAAVRSWQRINRFTVNGKIDKEQYFKLVGN